MCAFKHCHTLLEKNEALPLDVAVREAFDAFVTQPEASMPDDWVGREKIFHNSILKVDSPNYVEHHLCLSKNNF